MKRRFNIVSLCWMLAGGLTLAALGVACVEGTSDVQPDNCVAENVVDKELLAFLSKAKAVHLKADLFVEEDDNAAAIEALLELTEGPMPPGDVLAPEAREVLADTYARLAELRSELETFDQAQYDEAKADVERGLKHAVERTHYRGRLMEVLGEVEKRYYQNMVDAGDTRAAESAKARAIKALEEAVNIQDDVIRKTLEADIP
jgi:hypothetical protein